MSATRRAAVLVLAERAGLGIIGWWAFAAPAPGSVTGGLARLIHLPGSPAGAIVGPWQRDDGLWYQSIAAAGYGAHRAEAAFFPLYPAAVHVVGVVLRDSYGLAALLLSTVAYAAALVLLHRLVASDLSEEVARRSVLHLACAPFAFFFLAPFTEALFLLLAVACVLAARRRRLVVAAAIASLAAACRLQGVLLVVPLAVEVWAEMRERRRAGMAGPRAHHLALVLPVVSLAGVLLFLGRQDPAGQGFLAVERDCWGVHLAAPWQVFADSVRAIASGRHPEEVANLLAALLMVAALPFMWRRLPAVYTAFAAVMAAPVWFHENGYSPLMSAGRFSAVVFPLFVLLAVVTPSWRARRLVLTVSVALMTTFFLDFTRYHLVG